MIKTKINTLQLEEISTTLDNELSIGALITTSPNAGQCDTTTRFRDEQNKAHEQRTQSKCKGATTLKELFKMQRGRKKVKDPFERLRIELPVQKWVPCIYEKKH